MNSKTAIKNLINIPNKYNKTGGELSGAPVVQNNIAYSGKDNNGAIKDMIRINDTNALILGHNGITGYALYKNSTVCDIYHEGNKPTLSDIGAAAASHNHDYLPLAGGALTGNIKYSGGGWTGNVFQFKNGDANGVGVGIGGGGLTVVGSGESTDEVLENNTGATETLYLSSDQGIVLASNMQNGWASRKTVELKTNGELYVGANKVYHAGSKPTASEIGAASSSHNHDSSYLGKSSNAVSASKLATARTINGVSFDGTSNITITAAPTSHSHNYLPLSGGTVSGSTTFNSGITAAGSSWAATFNITTIKPNGSYLTILGTNNSCIAYFNVLSDKSQSNINVSGDAEVNGHVESFFHPNSGGYGFVGGAEQYFFQMYAKAFVTKSDKNTKTNIHEFLADNILEDVKDIKVYQYNSLGQATKEGIVENKRDINLGLMVQEAPLEIVDSVSEKGIDLYSYISYTFKALQEEIKVRESEIKELKEEIEKLKNV